MPNDQTPDRCSMPLEPPAELERQFDEVLFDLCRNDDYSGLYREFVRRFGQAL